MSSQRGSPSASIVGGPATGFSPGRAIALVEEIARETLPPGAAHECCGAFRRTHGTLTPLILRVRRMCLEGVGAGAYDAS